MHQSLHKLREKKDIVGHHYKIRMRMKNLKDGRFLHPNY